MKRRAPKNLTVALTVAALGLLALAGGAQAATLNLKCSGKGPQNKAEEYVTASCAVAAGQKRSIEGVLRNDKNRPVAGTLKVTFSKWIPQGEGAYSITPERTVEIKASAGGKFQVPVTTTTEETVYIEAVGDPTTEVSAITQEVNIQRYVLATAKKLGGGKVQVTVKGVTGPFKVSIAQEGYPVRGGAARRPNKSGVAVFDLGSVHGTFGIYVDAGELSNLFYLDAKPLTL